MRPFFYASLVMIVVSLAFAPPLEARGGKGGGGGHGRGGGGHGGGGNSGGPKWSRQQPPPGGGQRLAEHGQKPAQSSKPQFADKPSKSDKKQVKRDKHARSTSPNDPASPPTDAYNKKQKQLAIEQQNRDKRIAQAQHLREIGERNGNQNLLDNADRMEAFAHDHYARRVSQLEKFGVTDPLLNPGTGVTDPLLPGTTGPVNPPGDLGEFDLLPLLP